MSDTTCDAAIENLRELETVTHTVHVFGVMPCGKMPLLETVELTLDEIGKIQQTIATAYVTGAHAEFHVGYGNYDATKFAGVRFVPE